MVSFNGIDSLIVTMVSDGAAVGKPCKMKSGKTAAAAAADEEFQGVCQWLRDGLAGIQIKGFVTLGYTGETAPSVGYGQLCANGSGGVAVATTGPDRLIVDVDTTGKTVTFYI